MCIPPSAVSPVSLPAIFTEECIDGITVNTDECKDEIERSIGLVTALCPHIGYSKASGLAKKALRENKRIREVILEENIMKEDELAEILDPTQMI